MDIWALPGPSRFVDDIDEALRDGTSVIVRFALDAPSGLEGHLRERLSSVLDWRRVDARDPDGDPLQTLRSELCPSLAVRDTMTIGALARQSVLDGKLVWVDAVPPDARERWISLMLAYADICRGIDPHSRGVMVLCLSGTCVDDRVADEPALTLMDFRSIVKPLDLLVMALHVLEGRTMHPQHRALFAQAVSQLAQWDVVLAERLLAGTVGDVLAPGHILRDFAAERHWHADTPRGWEHGTIDHASEQLVVHSALLEVCGDERPIRSRLWSAQASVLLPLVEQRRVEIIRDQSSKIRTPVSTEWGSITDPLDLSIGQLAWVLPKASTTDALRRRIGRLTKVRNCLAHMEPAAVEDALHANLLSFT